MSPKRPAFRREDVPGTARARFNSAELSRSSVRTRLPCSQVHRAATEAAEGSGPSIVTTVAQVAAAAQSDPWPGNFHLLQKKKRRLHG